MGDLGALQAVASGGREGLASYQQAKQGVAAETNAALGMGGSGAGYADIINRTAGQLQANLDRQGSVASARAGQASSNSAVDDYIAKLNAAGLGRASQITAEQRAASDRSEGAARASYAQDTDIGQRRLSTSLDRMNRQGALERESMNSDSAFQIARMQMQKELADAAAARGGGGGGGSSSPYGGYTSEGAFKNAAQGLAESLRQETAQTAAEQSQAAEEAAPIDEYTRALLADDAGVQAWMDARNDPTVPQGGGAGMGVDPMAANRTNQAQQLQAIIDAQKKSGEQTAGLKQYFNLSDPANQQQVNARFNADTSFRNAAIDRYMNGGRMIDNPGYVQDFEFNRWAGNELGGDPYMVQGLFQAPTAAEEMARQKQNTAQDIYDQTGGLASSPAELRALQNEAEQGDKQAMTDYVENQTGRSYTDFLRDSGLSSKRAVEVLADPQWPGLVAVMDEAVATSPLQPGAKGGSAQADAILEILDAAVKSPEVMQSLKAMYRDRLPKLTLDAIKAAGFAW